MSLPCLELEGLEVFLVNGYRGWWNADSHASMTDMVAYWDVESDFVGRVASYFNETDIRYIDGHRRDIFGSPDSYWENRYDEGYENTIGMLVDGSLELDNSRPITFVAHSQGNAHAAGMVGAILTYQTFQNMLHYGEVDYVPLNVDLNFVALAVYQGNEFSLSGLVNVIQFTYENDMYGVNDMTGVPDANSEEKSFINSSGKVSGRLEAHSAVIVDTEALDEVIKTDKSQNVFVKKEDNNE